MDDEIAQLQKARQDGSVAKEGEGDRVALTANSLDKEVYGSDMTQFTSEIQDDVGSDDEAPGVGNHPATKRASINADRSILDQGTDADAGDDMAAFRERSGVVNTRIADRETEYQARRANREISPERGDAFSGKTPARSYKDIMMAQGLAREEAQIMQQIEKKKDRKSVV